MVASRQLSRAQRRALDKMGPVGVEREVAPDPGQSTTAALLFAVKSDCKCKACKVLRRIADDVLGPYDDDDDDDDLAPA